MFGNYFKTAFRNLTHNKFFSSINLLGLALSMACSLLIFLWVNDEQSVDAFHTNKNRLYSIIQRTYADDKTGVGYYTPGLLSEEIKRRMPEVQYAVAYSTWRNINTFQAGDRILKEQGEYAGEDFFKAFSFPLLQGNAATALNTPSGIAVSKKMAVNFFGSAENAFGKSIRFENKQNFIVTAVFDDIPRNSSLQFDFLINWFYLKKEYDWIKDWNNVSPYTAVVLQAGTNSDRFKTKIKHFLDGLNTKQTANYRVELDLQSFADTYLHGSFKKGQLSGGRIEYINLFSAVAIFILIIACINFMNLSTARSVKRAREIGVRKVIGAGRRSLIFQFIAEAMLLAFVALVLALSFAALALPYFNNLTGKYIVLPLYSLFFWLKLTGLTVFTGLLAGSYPAFILSSFNPVKVLKGAMKPMSADLFRKVSVVFQFTISMLLITATIVISQQVDYIQTKNLGFNRDHLISIPLEGDLVNQYAVFKQQALQLQSIQSVTQATQAPSQSENYWTNEIYWDGKNPNTKPAFVNLSVGYDFTKTMDVQLLEGRDFSPSFATDSFGYILNETALRQTGYQAPIGKQFTCNGQTGNIIGIIKDFHFNSLHDPVYPLILSYTKASNGNTIMIRATKNKTREALADLESLCRQLNPKFPFTYSFADADFQKLYTSETIIHKLADYFSMLAVFISSLGLLALVMFTAEQRIKEISIRKVLGASIIHIGSLLLSGFIKLIAIAMLVAIPAAWLFMHQWLQNFAYKIDMQWWMFALAGAITFLIALLIVSYQIIKVTLLSPVKNLRM